MVEKFIECSFYSNFKNPLKRFLPAISQARPLAQIGYGASKIPQERSSSIFHNCLEFVESGRLLAVDLNHDKGPEKVVKGFKFSGDGGPNQTGNAN